MDVSIRDSEIIRRLAQLLRDNGEKILSGGCTLALTTSSLQTLNDGFHQINEDNFELSFEVVPQQYMPSPTMQDLVLLHDFVQKTISLKVIHGFTNIKGRVNISLFRALQSLELKKIPIHLIEGLQKVRSKLHTLICSRCVQSLHDLFEVCGSDQSSPMSWSALRTVCLNHNIVDHLDASLRLLPMVDVLDLSHNCITNTDRYIEYLTELHHLNLGFNKLHTMPTFAISAKSKLRILILKHNRLANIKGVEELTNLKELNIAYNCLIDHQVLTSLHKLHRLTTLNLEGNPLYFHKRHRRLTIEKLSQKALPKMTVDGQLVSKTEIKQAARDVSRKQTVWSGHVQTHIIEASTSAHDQSAGDSTSGVDESDSVSPATNSSDSSHKKNRIKGKKSKGSKPVISDLDSAGEVSSLEGSSVPKPSVFDHLKTKQEMETIRNQLGPDWLTSLAAKREIANKNKEGKAITSETDDDFIANLTTTTDEVNKNSKITPKSMSSVPAKADEENGKFKKVVNSNDREQSKNKESHRHKSLPQNIDNDAEAYEQREKVIFRISDSVDTDTLEDNMSEHAKHSPSDTTAKSAHTVMSSSAECKQSHQQQPERKTSDGSDHQFKWKKSDEDYHTKQFDDSESDAFIIMCEQNTEEPQLIITVGERYLHEKDLNGQPLENLDLKCLLGVEKIKTTCTGEGSPCQVLPLLVMQFDYIKKDKRERRYVMEDEENAQELCDLLHPFLYARQMAAQYKDMMQCLKCEQQFRNTMKKGTNKADQICPCPECGSRMVIELDWNLAEQPTVTISHTPTGSPAFRPPVTSSNHHSPYKMTPPNPHSPCKLTPSSQQSPYKIMDMDSKEVEKYYTLTNISTASFISLDNRTSDSYSFRSPISSPSNYVTASSAILTERSSPEGACSSSFETEKVRSIVGVANSDSTVRKESHMSVDEPINSDLPRTGSLGFDTTDLSSEVNERALIQESDAFKQPVKNRESADGFHRKHSKLSMRTRKESTDSDILILNSSCTNEMEATESDITVLSNPSQSSIAVISSRSLEKAQSALENGSQLIPHSDRGFDFLQGGDDRSSMNTITESSPAGSLTTSTLCSMVSSVYEQSIYDNKDFVRVRSDTDRTSTYSTSEGVRSVSSLPGIHVHVDRTEVENTAVVHKVDSHGSHIERLNSAGSHMDRMSSAHSSSASLNASGSYLASYEDRNGGTASDSESTGTSSIHFWYNDYTHVDHRLKLHLVMKLLGNSEELLFVLKSDIVYHQKKETFPGLLVVSSEKCHILKIVLKESSVKLDKWLKGVDKIAVSELQQIRVGPGNQKFTLEFTSANFSFIIRDDQRCQTFVQTLSGKLEEYTSYNSKLKYKGVVESEAVTLSDLQVQPLDEAEGLDSTILLFIKAYKRSDLHVPVVDNKPTVTLVLTSSHIFHMDENYYHQMAAQNKPGNKSQYTVKDQQRLNDVAYIDLFRDSPLDVSIAFFNEESDSEISWSLTMETEWSLQSLLTAIKKPWKEEFGVDLMINVKDKPVN